MNTGKTHFKKGRIPWNKGLPKELQPLFGLFLSEETKKKISLKRKEFFLNGGIPPTKGKICDEKTREKIRQAALKRHPDTFKKSEEWKKQLSERMKKWWLKHPEMKKIFSESRKGENGQNWKGGKTIEGKIIRSSAQYKEWRKAIFERDDYRCFDCGAKSGEGKKVTLNADHIYPFATFPRLRFDINNGRTLCIDCHRKTDTYGINIKTNATTLLV